MSDFIAFFQSLGFPSALAVYLLWCLRDERRKCDERLEALERRVFGEPPNKPLPPKLKVYREPED